MCVYVYVPSVPPPTSQECADHIEKIWVRGNAAIKILRADLAEKHGQEAADELVPDVNGGVQLLKLRSAMHDTCNTANAVVPKLAEKKEASGKAFYGDDVWNSMTVQEKSLTDWLCGNHSRGLPVGAFNRLFETYLQENLGAEFQAAATVSGGRARLEKNGVALLRSMCKLTHDGWGAYAKGDGK